MKRYPTIILFFLVILFITGCQSPMVTVNFNLDGGQLASNSEVTLKPGATLNLDDFVPERLHYTFNYWYYTTSDENVIVTGIQTVNENMTLVAMWTKNVYTVNFLDESGSVIHTSHISYPNNIGGYTPISREGYSFEGWYLDSNLSNKVIEQYNVSSNLTLYPKWVIDNSFKYTIQFNSDGGNLVASVLVNPNSMVDLIPTPTKEGHTFLGWYDGDTLMDFSQPIDDHYDLTAHWEINTYTVSFDTIGGTTVPVQTYHYNEPFTHPSTPSKYNYDFNDWLLDDAPFEENTPIKTSLTLAASWTPLYDDNGTYRTYALDFESFNIHKIQSESSWVYAELLFDTLYTLDYDWALAIDQGLAQYVGDFTYVELLPSIYHASMALGDPIKLDDYGFQWRFQLNSDLSFSDGTMITASTFEYSWQELLSPTLANENAYFLFNQYYLPLLNAQSYHEQNTTTPWSEVGFKVIDAHTFEIELTEALTLDHLKRVLSYMPLTVVHPASYESAKDMALNSSSYGVVPHVPYGFGPYELAINNDDSMHFTKRNDTHFASHLYLVKSIDVYKLSDLTVANQYYDSGLIDTLDITNSYFNFDLDEDKLMRQTMDTMFGLIINVDYGRDQDMSNDNPYLKYNELRQALYFGIDRLDYSKFRFNSTPTNTLLGTLYYSHIDQLMNYRASSEAKGVYLDYSSLTNGFDSTKALMYFEMAYQKAIQDGLITLGEKIQISLTHQDTTLYTNPYLNLKAQYESLFGEDRFELILIPVANMSTIRSNYHYDMIMTGVEGATMNAPLMIEYLYQLTTSNTTMETTRPLEVSIELGQLKQVLLSLESELNLILSKTPYEQALLTKVNQLLSNYTGSTYISDLSDVVSDLYTNFMMVYDYPNRTTDFDKLVAAIESIVLDDMRFIPLYGIFKPLLNSNHVRYPHDYYHPSLGFGGYKYLTILPIQPINN